MKKGKIETPRSRVSERSPRASFSEKGPQPVPSRLNIITKNFIPSSVEEDLSSLPHKENEIKLLAKQIGIDYETEKSKYQWFLIQIVSLDLPVGWMKEEDPNGTIYYHNPGENTTSQKHPLISKFRLLFNEILENEMVGKSKMIALKEKVQKLEQEKEREREAQSPKKTKESTKPEKIKKSKTVTIVPGSSAGLKQLKGDLPTDRSSKGNAEQPQGLIDSDKSKERFDKVKEVLEQRRRVQEDKNNEIDNLTKTEDILNMCKQYYIEKFGVQHVAPPESIAHLETYNLVDPNEIVEAARLFNVKSTQAYLFWVLRAYCGLPLPEYWTKTFDTNLLREIYFNSCFDVKISVKPCYFYILELVNYIKQEAITDKDSFLHFSNKITLCDKLGRYYDVDLATMIKDLIEKPNGERKNYYTYHQKKENLKDDGQKVTRKRKKDELNPNYSDAHFLEIANQLEIDLNIEIHLLMVIEDFVRGREAVERWFFRQVPEGPAFWVNHEQQKAVNRYPYLKEIKKVIDDTRAKTKENSDAAKKHMKSEFSLIKTLFRKQPEDTAWKMLLDEAKNYVEFFLKLKSSGDGSPSKDNRTYNLSSLVRKVGTQLSKHDLMDLLFYCPFDFTQFISEEFLKSSESYLLKKIKLKNTGGAGALFPGDTDGFGGVNEVSFDAEDQDAAQNIKNKIEDSKKLLDIAANIKGLTLDPERKREFMKLLINFDKKYGDHQMVAALEKNIKNNISGEADLVKTLATSIQTQLQKNIGEEFEDAPAGIHTQSRGSPVLRDASGKRVENPDSITKVKDHLKLGTKIDKNGSATVLPNSKPGQQNKKDADENDPESYPSRDPSQERNDKKKLSGKTAVKDDSPSPKKIVGGISPGPDGRRKKKGKSKTKKTDNDGLADLKEEEENEEYEGSAQYSDADPDEMEDDEVVEEEIEVEEEVLVDGKMVKVKVVKKIKRSTKFEYDDDGNILFTHKKTQQLLKNLADEQDKHTIQSRAQSRSRTKKSTMKTGSLPEGADYFDGEFSPKNYPGRRASALENTEVIMQEIITENGERKFVPFAVTSASRMDQTKDFKRSPTLSPNQSVGLDARQGGRSSVKHAERSDSPQLDGSRVKESHLGRANSRDINQDEMLPMVIGSSLKSSYTAINDNQGRESGWDPNMLMSALDKYNVDALDNAYRRNKRKEDEEIRSEFGDETKAADATGLTGSRNQLTPVPKANRRRQKEETMKLRQTYKSLEPGLQNLETNKGGAFEKTDKPGVWTHVELFELTAGTSRTDNHRNVLDPQRMVNNGNIHYRENHQIPAQYEETFYTPFRKGNIGAKRYTDYMNYLNTLVFMKKLNSLILDFLIKHFAAMQQNTVGVDFDPEDPAFRKIFKSRYQKLIKQLRGNLLKKKDFIQSVYSKVFNSSENIPESVFQSLHDLQQSKKPPQYPPKINQVSRTGDGQNLSIGRPNVDNIQLQDSIKLDLRSSKSAELKGVRSEASIKLPQLANKKMEGLKKFSVTTIGFKPSISPRDEAAFGDGRIRTSNAGERGETLEDGYNNDRGGIKKPRRMNLSTVSQKEIEAQKLLRSLNESDLENYKHYWNILGDPLKLDSSAIFSKLEITAGIQPYHVLLMGHRLGLQIHNADEPDLAWIAYLALVVKLPDDLEKNLRITSPQHDVKYQKICKMKSGEHPGDKYFKTVLLYNQARRKILFEYMTEDEQIRYAKSQAWAKLRETTGGVYYFNFMTKQKTINIPTDTKDIISRIALISSQPEVKEKLKLINEIMLQNDHAFAQMKNKQPKTIKTHL